MDNNKQNLATLRLVNSKIENVEWVFQFNNDDPVFLAAPNSTEGAEGLTLKIGNTGTSNILFKDNRGNEFKIFAREKQGGNK